MSKSRFEMSEWNFYFETISKQLQGRWLETKICGAGVDDADSWVPLEELFYDATEDALFVNTRAAARTIQRPVEIYIVDRDKGPATFFVRNSRRQMEAVKLRMPLLLTAQHSKRSEVGVF